MLIGHNADTFAFEYELLPPAGGKFLGHFRIWAGSKAIGNFSDVVVMTAVQRQVERSLIAPHTRSDADLTNETKEKAMKFLRSAIFGAEENVHVAESLSRRYSLFNLSQLGISAFDGLFVFLMHCHLKQRLIWQSLSEDAIHEVIMPPDTYEAVAEDFLKSLGNDIGDSHAHKSNSP